MAGVVAGPVEAPADVLVQVELRGAQQLVELGDEAGPDDRIIDGRPCMSQASTT